jgi:hypothetical protein
MQHREIPMPFMVQREHYSLSPYFDYLSFFFNKRWRRPAKNTLSLMIKLADQSVGHMSGHGVEKTLTAQDKHRLDEAVTMCREILQRLGIERRDMFLGTVNAGHPGGMLPLTESEAGTFRDPRLPENLYVADATLLPNSLGNPPILTIAALAKRVSRHCLSQRS